MAPGRPWRAQPRHRPDELPLTRPVTFSVAIPSYGQAEYIGTALASLRAQRTPVELAALDATPDDSVQRVLQDAEVPVAYGYHHRDDGQGAAIQDGWNHTTGEVVAWLCADDCYFPGALARVEEVFERCPEVDAVFGHTVHMSATGAFVGYFPSSRATAETLSRGCPISQPSCFVRRRAMERVGGLNTRLHFTMDWDFWLRLARAGCRFHFLDTPIAAVRVHPQTKTMGGGGRRLHEIARLLNSHGVPTLSRWRALLAFLRQDLRVRSSHFLFRSSLDLLDMLETRVRTSARPVIRGIECVTNRVKGACTVRLPRYSGQPAEQIVVVTDRAVALTMQVNDRQARLEAIGPQSAARRGPTVVGHGYRAAAGDLVGEDLSIELSADAGGWRLLGLAVN